MFCECDPNRWYGVATAIAMRHPLTGPKADKTMRRRWLRTTGIFSFTAEEQDASVPAYQHSIYIVPDYTYNRVPKLCRAVRSLNALVSLVSVQCINTRHSLCMRGICCSNSASPFVLESFSAHLVILILLIRLEILLLFVELCGYSVYVCNCCNLSCDVLLEWVICIVSWIETLLCFRPN